MENLNHYTAIIYKDYLGDAKKEKEYYKVLYDRPCFYCKDYNIIEFELTQEAKDMDLEVMLDTVGALVIHEEFTNGFCLMENDIKELEELFCWESSGTSLMAELLSRAEKINLLKKQSEKDNNTLDIYYKTNPLNNKSEWISLAADKGEIFLQDVYYISYGLSGKPQSIWIPHLMEEYSNYFFVVLKEEVEEDEYDIFNTPYFTTGGTEDEEYEEMFKDYDSQFDDEYEIIRRYYDNFY